MAHGDDTILTPGDCLAGRYVILEEIGRGGFGVVYRAVQQGVNRHVALKTLRRNTGFIPGFDFIEAFHKEALHTSQLKHPNTITVFDFGETDDGLLYLVTEFLEGETLYERMWRDRIMNADVAIHVGKQIAKSLAEAHNVGIIHGDLKPANIFLCNLYGERDFVKVLDFGIAKIIGEVDPAGMGTPEYMSPEQFSGQPLLAASDIYSLGLILFEMVMGRRPFDDEDTGKLARKHLLDPLPPMSSAVEKSPLGYLIRKATAKEPANRYEDGWALYEALENLDAVSDSGARPARPASSLPSSGPNLFRPSGEVSPTPTLTSASDKSARDDDRIAFLPTASSQPDGKARSDDTARSRPRPDPSSVQLQPGESRLMRGKRVKIVGRNNEQALLLDGIARVADQERASVVIMGGAAGVGKTRLAQWLIEEANLPNDALCGSGAHRDGSPFVLEGIRQSFARALGQTGKDFGAKVARRIKEKLQEVFGQKLSTPQANAVEVLYGPFGVDEANVEMATICDLLMDVAQKRLLVLHLDNLQSADPPTLDLLETLVGKIGERPCRLFVLCTVRREALPAVPQLAKRMVSMVRSDAVVPRTLDALDETGARQLTEWVVQRELEALGFGGQVDEALYEGLTARAHGNPLYIMELSRHLIDSEYVLLEAEDQVARLKPGVQLERMIPPKIGGLLRLRVAQLTHRHTHGQEIEHVLLRCALLGSTVPVELLSTYLSVEAEGTQEATPGKALAQMQRFLPILSQEDLLSPTRRQTPGGLEDAMAFTQPLIHQILEERVLRLPQSRELHRFAARAKRDYIADGGILEDGADEIGTHYALADAHGEAVDFFIESAREATLTGELIDAVAWLERAREATSARGDDPDKSLSVLLDLCYFRSLLGGFVDLEAVKVLGERLAHELNSAPAQAELNYMNGLLAQLRGRVTDAEGHFELAVESFGAMMARATPLDDARRFDDLSLLHLSFDHLPAPIGLGLARLGLAWVSAQRACFEAAQDYILEAQGTFESCGLLWGEARSLQLLGELYVRHGYVPEAERALRASLSLYERTTPALGASHVRLTLAELDVARGEVEPAVEVLKASLDEFKMSGQGPGVAAAARLFARLAAQRGKVSVAYDYYRQSLELTQSHSDWTSLLGLLVEFARFLSHQEDGENAIRATHKAITLLREVPESEWLPSLQLLMGVVMLNLRRYDEAQPWLRSSLESSDAVGDRRTLAEAHSELARLPSSTSGREGVDRALGHLQVARRLASGMGTRLPAICRAEESLADLLQHHGDIGRATRLIESARSGWLTLGNQQEATRLEERIGQR